MTEPARTLGLRRNKSEQEFLAKLEVLHTQYLRRKKRASPVSQDANNNDFEIYCPPCHKKVYCYEQIAIFNDSYTYWFL